MTNIADYDGTSARIRILPDDVSNQIAAGEVVERPASVIKELVENALDAGAKSVHIAFRNGGKSYIEVTDDGCGMSRDDALMAFEPHATSKIRSVSDLRSINSFGFRGEALPSIASVSRIILTTSQPEASVGVEVVLEGGRLKGARDFAPTQGLRAQVKDLFFNTPVRRKFLRSEGVEAGKSYEAALRQAISRPDVAFRITRDGKETLNLAPVSGDEALKTRVGSIFGQTILTELSRVDLERGDMRVYGYIARPQVTRSNRQTQYVYVNGRFTQDRLLNFAIMEGYRSLLPKGRFPLVFLFLDLPCDMVDVNTHPTKIEVRFRDTNAVRALVIDAIHTALGETKDTGAQPFAPANVPLRADPFTPEYKERPFNRRSISFSQPVAASFEPMERSCPVAERNSTGATELKHYDANFHDDFKPVGQIFGSFILLEDGDRLLLIDQHTAHERVLYEKFTNKYRENRVDSQELLFPAEIELSHAGSAILRKMNAEFETLGFYLDEFGDNIFTLRSAPALLIGKDYKAIIEQIVDRAENFGMTGEFSKIAEDVINIMACRGAVKANQKLDNREIGSLISSLRKCALPYTCPHGRPISLTIEKNDLLKGFLRK